MPTDVLPVESSPTLESVAPPTLDSLTTEQRQAWRKTGTLPDAAAASSPAPPEKAPSTEGSLPPASEPGTPKSAKKNAESRIQELLTERAQLRSELEAARRPVASTQVPDVPQAASSPAPVSAKYPEFAKWLETAGPDRREYEDYLDDRAVHVFQQQHQAIQAQQHYEAAEKVEAERIGQYRQHAERFLADHPDYWQMVTPVTQTPRGPTADAIGDVILEASNQAAVLYELGSHLEEFHRILALPPHRAAFEVGLIASRLAGPVPPAPKTLSTAPMPPPTLGSRPATPVDDVEAAIKRGDFASYKLAMNRRGAGR